MQPQQQPQQVVIQQPGVVQPMYIAQPVTRAPVVETYAHRQSTVLGAVLIVAGALSIIFNIIDLAVGIRATYTRTIIAIGVIPTHPGSPIHCLPILPA